MQHVFNLIKLKEKKVAFQKYQNLLVCQSGCVDKKRTNKTQASGEEQLSLLHPLLTAEQEQGTASGLCPMSQPSRHRLRPAPGKTKASASRWQETVGLFVLV